MSTAALLSRLRSISVGLPQWTRLYRFLHDLVVEVGNGGDVLWGNTFVVDAVLGDNATAVPGSLKYTYGTIQAAVDAAKALLLLGATFVATVLPLPGAHVLQAAVVLPNVSGLSIMGLSRETTFIIAPGNVFTGAYTHAGSFVEFANIGAFGGGKSFSLVCTGGALGSSQCQMTSVECASPTPDELTGFSAVLLSQFLGGAEDLVFGTCGSVGLVDVFVAAVTLHSCNGLTIVGGKLEQVTYDGAATSLREIRFDRGTTLSDGLTVDIDSSNFRIHTNGAWLADVSLTLTNANSNSSQQVVDLGGSYVGNLTIVASNDDEENENRFAVSARGCQSGYSPFVVSIDSAIVDLDLRGFAGVLLDSFITATGASTVDRDKFGAHTFTIPEGEAPGIGAILIEPPLPSAVTADGFQVVVESDYEVSTWVTGKSAAGYSLNYGGGAGGTIRTQCIRTSNA